MHPTLRDIDVTANPLVAALIPALSEPAALVGGVVRDLLLGLPSGTDVDVVVEGDGVRVAREVADRLDATLRTHGRFGTAVMTVPGHEGHVDFVTARRETYDRPNALPRIEPAHLADDLARRDFSINALAVWLSGPGAGTLVDPTGGLADLDARRLRLLRAHGFVEDTSRLVRAARYAGRLGFHLDTATAAEAVRAAPTLDWSNPRTALELRRLLRESDPVPGLLLLREFGAPGLRADLSEGVVAIDAAAATPGAPAIDAWVLRLGVVCERDALHAVALPESAVRAALDMAEGLGVARHLMTDADRPSERDAALGRTPPSAQIAALAAGAGDVAVWWREARDLRLGIGGSDLIADGATPGPHLGRALAAARAAMLDGTAPTTAEQRAVALASLGLDDGAH